jgi:hypothetical protein
VTPFWAQIHANQSQNADLTELRDTLLPRLLSGEVSVAHLAERVEAAL